MKSEEEKEQEVLKQRELEQELENERPCVFKSISPVRNTHVRMLDTR